MIEEHFKFGFKMSLPWQFESFYNWKKKSFSFLSVLSPSYPTHHSKSQSGHPPFLFRPDVDGGGWRCDDGGGYAIRIAALPCSLDGGSSVVQVLGAIYFGLSVAPMIWDHSNSTTVTGFEVMSYIYSVWTIAADLSLSLCRFDCSVVVFF